MSEPTKEEARQKMAEAEKKIKVWDERIAKQKPEAERLEVIEFARIAVEESCRAAVPYAEQLADEMHKTAVEEGSKATKELMHFWEEVAGRMSNNFVATMIESVATAGVGGFASLAKAANAAKASTAMLRTFQAIDLGGAGKNIHDAANADSNADAKLSSDGMRSRGQFKKALAADPKLQKQFEDQIQSWYYQLSKTGQTVVGLHIAGVKTTMVISDIRTEVSKAAGQADLYNQMIKAVPDKNLWSQIYSGWGIKEQAAAATAGYNGFLGEATMKLMLATMIDIRKFIEDYPAQTTTKRDEKVHFYKKEELDKAKKQLALQQRMREKHVVTYNEMKAQLGDHTAKTTAKQLSTVKKK